MTHTGEKPFACQICDYRLWSEIFTKDDYLPRWVRGLCRVVSDFHQSCSMLHTWTMWSKSLPNRSDPEM